MVKQIKAIETSMLLFISTKMKHPWLDYISACISNPYLFVIPGIFAVAGLIWYDWAIALRCLTAGTLAACLADGTSTFIKRKVFNIRRPVGELHFLVKIGKFARGSRSFPSNHATNTAAFGATLVYYYPVLLWPVVAGVLLVGFARLYSGAHWPTDILAGWVVGFIYAAGVLTAMNSLGF